MIPILDLTPIIEKLISYLIYIILIGIIIYYGGNYIQFIIYHINLSIGISLSPVVSEQTLGIIQKGTYLILIGYIVKGLYGLSKK